MIIRTNINTIIQPICKIYIFFFWGGGAWVGVESCLKWINNQFKSIRASALFKYQQKPIVQHVRKFYVRKHVRCKGNLGSKSHLTIYQIT